MIFDTIENYTLYKNLSPHFAEALGTLKYIESKKEGRYDIDGDNIYCLVQRYKTKTPVDKLEAHRKYIDIQFLAQGSERIGCAPINHLKPHTPYNEEEDVEFFLADSNTTFLNMTKGSFAIFWPTDAHMPGSQVSGTEEVLKIVFKIRIKNA